MCNGQHTAILGVANMLANQMARFVAFVILTKCLEAKIVPLSPFSISRQHLQLTKMPKS